MSRLLMRLRRQSTLREAAWPAPTGVKILMQHEAEHLDLMRSAAEGAPLDFLFFWSHKEQGAKGSVGPGCLSQWFPSPFAIDGRWYATAEHYMMAEKARVFGDDEAVKRVLSSEDPAEARAIGREVSGFDEKRWMAQARQVVLTANVAKFSSNLALATYLLSTSPQVLVEASPSDRVWGIGLDSEDPRARNPSAWPGRNLLGFALMRTREQLNRETS